MTTEYHDDAEDDSSSFWNKESPPVSFSGVSRFRRWLFPALGAAVILVLIIAVGASSREDTVRFLFRTLSPSSRFSDPDAAKDVRRMKFAVESNRDELSSVSEALKQLSVLDTLSRTVTKLKCSFERFTNNGSVSGGCCPLGWEAFGSSCYFYSKMSLTWHEAKDWCNGHESHLVILLTDEDWDFVTQHTMGAFHWVGLTDERTGKWEWVNETPYIMNRRRWKPGQPDNWTGHGLGAGTEDCAHLHHDGRLNDLHYTTRAAERQEPQNTHHRQNVDSSAAESSPRPMTCVWSRPLLRLFTNKTKYL
uniref:Asialoglycoprotein receptor 1-like n=1 Tax=Mastacembelus armatus TaxID=205130 RepID=A0A3Q3LRK5_9TELE